MEFKKLAEVEMLEATTDTTNVLIEENGEIKRVAKTEVGGMGIPTAIIKSSNYDNMLAGIQTTMAETEEITYECINMTFEEAYEIMASGQPLNVIGMLAAEGCFNLQGVCAFLGTATGSELLLVIINEPSGNQLTLFWTTDGLSTEAPSSK